MGKFYINGGNALEGDVVIQGAKNSILPLFAGAILTEDEVIIENVPHLSDIENMGKIIKNLGAEINIVNNMAVINAKNLVSNEIPNKLAKELRSSIFLLGSVLARQKYAKVSFPGGCDIGLRPIDIHIKGLRELNIKIVEKAGYIYCDATKKRGGNVILDYPSVGATENVMLASVIGVGTTKIYNPAREPEINDLQNFLNKMGGKITGAGTSVITIEGVSELKGTRYKAMPDRIVAGTYAIATAMAGGQINLIGANHADIFATLAKLSKTSCHIDVKNDIITISSLPDRVAIEQISTQPYPGFPTDMQAQMMALQAVSSGVSVINENIFENRFRHVSELNKMGANIKTHGKTAIVKGVKQLYGANVYAEDLRGGASLVLAGLNAKGITIVNNINHIDRGYESIESVLSKIGADIKRI